jgi:hypothetical protein
VLARVDDIEAARLVSGLDEAFAGRAMAACDRPSRSAGARRRSRCCFCGLAYLGSPWEVSHVTQPPGAPQNPGEQGGTQLAAEMDSSRGGLDRAVSFVGAIAAALGAVKLPALHGLALAFGTIAVICGVLSVAAAIISLAGSSGVLVRVNTDEDLRHWYYRRIRESARRAYLTRVALALLLATILSGGVALVISIVAPRVGGAAITVTQTVQSESNATATSITVKVEVQGIVATDYLSVTVTRQGKILGRAVVTPAADGSGTATLTIEHIAAAPPVVIDEFTHTQSCQAVLGAAAVPTVRCQSR